MNAARRVLLISLIMCCRLTDDTARAQAPYPASPAIAGVQWGRVVDMGTDNDNWPCTWADDGCLYASAGDGGGFGGPRKSAWICRIAGHPDKGDLKGTNVSPLAGGDGKDGLKASGILMVDGVLYMWVRNAEASGRHCLIMRSGDHGGSWSQGFTFSEFGYLTFINYGKDYAGARDGYVYSVGHDDPSAYSASAHMVLLRVPKSQVMNRDAYEVFAGPDDAGAPTWSKDLSARKPVFTNLSGGTPRCCRGGISYNAALGRYLWWQQYFNGTVDTRRAGGFGIYDAPEPWGPWTTVYFTAKWDVGPGDQATFPTKFMSADGKTCWLVYSGDDSLRLRKATLDLPHRPDGSAHVDGNEAPGKGISLPTCPAALGAPPAAGDPAGR